MYKGPYSRDVSSAGNPSVEPNITSIGKPELAKLWPFLYIQDGRQGATWCRVLASDSFAILALYKFTYLLDEISLRTRWIVVHLRADRKSHETLRDVN